MFFEEKSHHHWSLTISGILRWTSRDFTSYFLFLSGLVVGSCFCRLISGRLDPVSSALSNITCFKLISRGNKLISVDSTHILTHKFPSIHSFNSQARVTCTSTTYWPSLIRTLTGSTCPAGLGRSCRGYRTSWSPGSLLLVIKYPTPRVAPDAA